MIDDYEDATRNDLRWELRRRIAVQPDNNIFRREELVRIHKRLDTIDEAMHDD